MQAPSVTRSQFVHLRLTSEYSLVEGILRSEQALELAENNHMPALAITDVGNMFGAVKFAKKALKKNLSNPQKRTYNIQPIIGSQLWVRSKKFANRSRVIALTKNTNGYKNLCSLLSDSYIKSKSADQATIILEELESEKLKDLFILGGHLDGDVGGLLLADYYEKALALATYWQDITDGNYFLELQKARRGGEIAINEGSIAIAEQLEIPLVATHPIMFATPEDFDAHEVRYCIANNENFSNSNRPRPFTPAQYFTTTEEMVERFNDYPEAIENSALIAKSCSFMFDFLLDELAGKETTTYHMPVFSSKEDSTNENVDDNELFYEQAKKGLIVRLRKLFADDAVREKKTVEYMDRLKYEVQTISEMGFSSYYLVVLDFINWAKNQAIPVGPGRGSGAGSIAAYSLGITDIDPINNGLLFERFLNKERKSMPDFDIDFCENRRHEVIDYVRRKYGSDRVANIITYMSMAARASIKDCGRAMGAALPAVNSLTELIPNEIGINLAKAYENEPLIKAKLKEEPILQEVWNMARKLEDLPRNAGVHAAGILITPLPLTTYCPLYRDSNNADEPSASQFDMKDIESLGLVKFDFLGLSTLTVIDNAVSGVRKTNNKPDFTIDNIPENDEQAYKIFQNGQTNTIFQCESQVCKDLERRIRIDDFEEITALMALNRPGPLNSGMVDDYINVKHKKAEIKIFDERIAKVLEPTYGVIIYQEQVMQIAQILAKYSLGEADILRRAMGKKDDKLMAENRDVFVERAKKNNTNPEVATELFNLIEKFAEYGFNKSHSAAYALIAYQTAYLKAHHPAEYMSSVMSSEIGGSNLKIAQAIGECRHMGLTVTNPSINFCEYKFIAKDTKTVVFGLGAIKGLGQGAVKNLVEIRVQGLFKNFNDFLSRVDRTLVNKRAVEALIKAGAFDVIGDEKSLEVGNEKELGKYRQYYLDYIAKSSDAESANTNSLFGDESENVLDDLPEQITYSKRQNVIWENDVLEFSWSGHLIDFYKKDLRALSIPTIDEIAVKQKVEEFFTWSAGIITYTRTRKTKMGTMISLFLEDGSESVLDIAVFNKLLTKAVGDKTVRDFLKEGNLIFVYGAVRNEDAGINNQSSEMPRMRAEEIVSYNDALQRVYSITLPVVDDELTKEKECNGAVNYFVNKEQNIDGKVNVYFAVELSKNDVQIKQIKASYELDYKINLDSEKLLMLREAMGVDYGELYFSPLPIPEIKPRWQKPNNG